MTNEGAAPVRPRPALFRALGNAEPPLRVDVAGRTYEQVTVFKHDSWAATALFGSGDARIICKFNRIQPIFIVPMRWLGRALARREARFLAVLADLELVPDDPGTVFVDGAPAPHAVARVFVDGETFRGRHQIEEAFIHELGALMETIHARGVAYVDLHKRENVIVGPGGRPYLIDFQVSLSTGERFPWNTKFFGRFVRLLQEIDLYHVRKHHVRLFPERFTPEERESHAQPPAAIGAHRRFAKPLRRWRRALLTRLRIRDASGQASSESEPEVAFRASDTTPPPRGDRDGAERPHG